MPSSTFLNLPAEKQEKLLEAATREFSHRPFNEASINQIIKEAAFTCTFRIRRTCSAIC